MPVIQTDFQPKSRVTLITVRETTTVASRPLEARVCIEAMLLS